MLGEQHLRALSTNGALAVIVCAGMCHLARQYWVGTTTKARREECALDTSKRRFVERMWSLVTQDNDTENDLVKDLGPADHLGLYTSTSAVNPLQTIYLRRAPSSGTLGGFEWSVEKLVWLPTSTILDDVLSIDHERSFWMLYTHGKRLQILIRRLEAERLLTSSKLSMAQTGAPITHPPELDLPQSLKVPENIRGDVRVPQEFRCPLGSGVMSQPVVAPSGLTYDRAVIEQWVARFRTDPATGAPLQVSQLYPNLIIRDLIQAWMVSNAHKLDPALVQRVTRDCTPPPFLTTPVSEHTPVNFDRTSSYGFGSEHTSSMVLDGVPTHGSASSKSAAFAAAAAAGVVHRGSTQLSTDLLFDSRPSTSSATHASQCHRSSDGGHYDHTPTSIDAQTPVAAVKQRRHSTALSGRSVTIDALIPATSQQEFSPMGTASFPAGLLCPAKQQQPSPIAPQTQDKRVSSSSSLPVMWCPPLGDVIPPEDGGALSLSAASPLCCASITDVANTNAQETVCNIECAYHDSEKITDAAVAGDVLCQQRLPPVKLPSRTGSRTAHEDTQLVDIASDSVECTAGESPGYQVPRSWDSDEVLRSTGGAVKLLKAVKAEQSDVGHSVVMESSRGRADQEELDRLIA